MAYTTEQENFWAGEFGDAYIKRNQGETLAAANKRFFSRILRSAGTISSVIEFGANIGLNLISLGELLPRADLAAVEINEEAVAYLEKIDGLTIHRGSILDFPIRRQWDLVLTRGVLIHMDPGVLQSVYQILYRSSARYICVAEYYNPTPVSIEYRGYDQQLFKRDFAGELMDRYPELNLVDYGFTYHRDPDSVKDDLTWFLLEKSSADGQDRA